METKINITWMNCGSAVDTHELLLSSPDVKRDRIAEILGTSKRHIADRAYSTIIQYTIGGTTFVINNDDGKLRDEENISGLYDDDGTLRLARIEYSTGNENTVHMCSLPENIYIKIIAQSSNAFDVKWNYFHTTTESVKRIFQNTVIHNDPLEILK